MSDLLPPVPGHIIQATHADGRIFRRGRAWPHLTSKGVEFTDTVLVEHMEIVGDDTRPNEPDKLIVRGIPNKAKAPNGKALRFECFMHPFVTGIVYEDELEQSVAQINEARLAEQSEAAAAAAEAPESEAP